MSYKKMSVTVLVVGFILAIAYQGFAQEDAMAPANVQVGIAFAGMQVPPQVVSDGGVEAVREAQEAQPAAYEKRMKASQLLKDKAKSRGWRDGWDPRKNRAIAIESADFKTQNPASDPAFFIKREMAAKKAVLMAKATIIHSINQDMSAMDLVNMPGTDVNRELGAERARINAEIARQKEIVANLLEKVDKAEAAVLRGTTYGDRLNDLMVAAIKKLNAEYDKDARDRKAWELYVAAKEGFEVELEKYEELKEKAEAMQTKVIESQESAVESMAKMPLYGASVIMQTESWDDVSGIYQVAVILCWSYAMERSARAIVTGEEFSVTPSESAKSIHDWLDDQYLPTMVGPRQYLDRDGNRWFLGITARPYDDEMSSTGRRKNKGIADMFAQQMTAFCLWADVESYKLAQQAMESRGNDAIQSDAVAESFAEKLSQSFQNKKIRGMHRLSSAEVMHPITGSTIYVTVYGINSRDAKTALEIEKLNYATEIMDNRHQSVERGRDAANIDASKASKNRRQDFQQGYNEQSAVIGAELQSRQPVKQPAKGATIIINNAPGEPAPAKPKQSTSGTFGGDAEISDDF